MLSQASKLEAIPRLEKRDVLHSARSVQSISGLRLESNFKRFLVPF